MMNLEEIEEYLHQNIPLSKAMGAHIVSVSMDKVVIGAPIAENINHKKTVFGGSLHAIATLACWTLLYANLRDYPESAAIVIAHSEIDFHLPVTSDFMATCSKPQENEWNRFLSLLKKKEKARVVLASSIYQGETLAVSFKGTFAALKNR